MISLLPLLTELTLAATLSVPGDYANVQAAVQGAKIVTRTS